MWTVYPIPKASSQPVPFVQGKGASYISVSAVSHMASAQHQNWYQAETGR